MTTQERAPANGDILCYLPSPDDAPRVVCFRGWYSGNQRAFRFSYLPEAWEEPEDDAAIWLNGGGHALLMTGIYVEVG
jgi:hypothetical protein